MRWWSLWSSFRPAQQLVAYVAPAAGRSLATAELRAYLAARLPSHMVPALWVVLAALPRLPNGKLDRKSLPAPQAPDIGALREPPRTPVEELLHGLWAEVLALDPERFGVEDDFFALGGHSLLAMRAVSRLREALGVELPLASLFERPTIAGLAVEVGERLVAGEHEAPPPIERASREGEVVASFAQERMAFLDRFEPASGRYNVPLAFALAGPLDPRALRSALEAIVDRHEVLRTTFDPAGRPEIAPRSRLPWAVIDLTGLGDREPEAERLARTRGVLGPSTWEPRRSRARRWCAAAPRAWRFLFTLHHAAVDGASIGVLARELEELYAAGVEGRAAALQPLALQYADFAAWQRRWLDGERLEAKLAWWRRELEGAPQRLELPTDRPYPAVAAVEVAGSPSACRRRSPSGSRGAGASWGRPASCCCRPRSRPSSAG